ncbi:MAG: DNA methyltransferase [Desulfobacterales bacterium]
MGIFVHVNTLKIPDEWFAELLGIFEHYHFTIEENTPVETEISIDPEMLGRIFENLLAEINPETGETARKSTGSYYTPRAIVEYMTDESLRQILVSKTGIGEARIARVLSWQDAETDLTDAEKDRVTDALDQLKILDPACGSGAFPMGILQKMILVLQKTDPDSRKWLKKLLANIPDPTAREMMRRKLEGEKDLWNYTRKLGVIQSSIYGIDIQPVAAEIAKLRFFLSLVVDEKVSDNEEENRGILPLPNLEFKFVCANALIGLPKGDRGIFESQDEIDRLRELHTVYFSSHEDEKEAVKKEFAQVQKRMSERLLDWNEIRDSEMLHLAMWEPFSGKSCGWFDPEWMFGIKDGFDIVIGNPPYGIKLKAEEMTFYDKKFREYKPRTKNSAIYFKYLADILLKNCGINTFIIPKSFCYSAGWANSVKFIVKNLSRLIDTGKAFENVLLEQIIFVKQKSLETSEYLTGLYEENRIVELDRIPKNIWHDYGVMLAGQSKPELALINKILQTCNHKFGEYILIERGLNWQNKVANNIGKTPIYRGAQLNKYFLDNATDFIDLSNFSKDEYAYQLQPKVLNQLAIAHVKNPYPHFYLQAALDLKNILVFETISCTFGKSDKIDSKFIVGFNNSKIFAWLLYKFIYSNAIRSTRYDYQYVGRIPCPDLNHIKQEPVIEIVDQILKEKQANPKADTTALENRIDELVYELYDLTEEEIAIVEGKQK